MEFTKILENPQSNHQSLDKALNEITSLGRFQYLRVTEDGTITKSRNLFRWIWEHVRTAWGGIDHTDKKWIIMRFQVLLNHASSLDGVASKITFLNQKNNWLKLSIPPRIQEPTIEDWTTFKRSSSNSSFASVRNSQEIRVQNSSESSHNQSESKTFTHIRISLNPTTEIPISIETSHRESVSAELEQKTQSKSTEENILPQVQEHLTEIPREETVENTENVSENTKNLAEKLIIENAEPELLAEIQAESVPTTVASEIQNEEIEEARLEDTNSEGLTFMKVLKTVAVISMVVLTGAGINKLNSSLSKPKESENSIQSQAFLAKFLNSTQAATQIYDYSANFFATSEQSQSRILEGPSGYDWSLGKDGQLRAKVNINDPHIINDSYEGEINTKIQYHGQGTRVYSEVKMDSTGKVLDKTVFKYIGEWKEGLQNGKGSLFEGKLNALLYEGEFRNALKNGHGKLFYPNGKIQFEGQFVDDQIQGEGTYYFDNGFRIEGKFQKGIANGFSSLLDPSGQIIFKGNFFLNSFRTDDGIFVFLDKEGILHDHFDNTWSVDNQGNLKNEKPLKSPSAHKDGLYFGEKDWYGNMYGDGIFQYPNGLVLRGWWENDLPKKNIYAHKAFSTSSVFESTTWQENSCTPSRISGNTGTNIKFQILNDGTVKDETGQTWDLNADGSWAPISDTGSNSFFWGF